jgi:WD40 repeat protein
MAISPEGRLLAWCSLDGSFGVFDLQDRRLVSHVSGHVSATCSVTWVEDELWVSGDDGTLKRWQVHDGNLTLEHSMQASTSFHLVRVVHGGWAASTGEGVLLVSADGSTIALRLDVGRNIDALEVSSDLRHIAAGITGEIVVVDMHRRAIATAAISSPLVQQIGFLDARSLAFSEATALKTLQVEHLDYIPFQALPEPRHRTTF